MCDCAQGNVHTPAMAGGSVSADPDELTLDNVRDGKVKYKNLKKDQLQELCATLLGRIEDLELGLEQAKVPHNVSTPDETFELRAELKELKEAVFVDESGTNAMGDKPPAHVPRVVQAALTPDGAIAILEDTIKRLRLLPQ
jgi:hypothetical protein